MHGKFPRNLEENLVDNEQSYKWVKFGDSEGETEIRIMAAQDQTLVQIILKVKFWRKKFRVNVGYVYNMKEILTT